MNKQKKAQTINISPLRGGHAPEPIDMPFGVLSRVPDVITHAKFCVNRLRGFSAATARKVPFPILFWTTLTTVLHYRADCDWVNAGQFWSVMYRPGKFALCFPVLSFSRHLLYSIVLAIHLGCWCVYSGGISSFNSSHSLVLRVCVTVYSGGISSFTSSHSLVLLVCV